MAMLHITTGWTADMLGAFPDDGKRYEIIGGELIVNPSPSWRHQGMAAQLTAALLAYLQTTNTGWLVPDVDVEFNPENTVRPDLLVAPLVNGRPPRSLAEAGRLLLVVEIASRSTRNRDRHAKRVLYLGRGVPEYWIVDQRKRWVERWRPGAKNAEILRATLEWRPDPAQPPFVVDLPGLFERIGGEE